MDAVGLDSQRNVGAGVDQESSSPFSVLSSQFRTLADRIHGVPRQRFQFARGKVFFTKLDVVDAGTRGFANFFQQVAPARTFVAGKRAAVSDVTEDALGRHSLCSLKHLPPGRTKTLNHRGR